MTSREYLLNRDIARAKKLFEKRNYNVNVVMDKLDSLGHLYGDCVHESDKEIVETFKRFKKSSLETALYILEG